ncbi:MAG: nucleotide sugar dehydrogenase [Planctomycetes bacterium]|nr:nucleotide sugar dehydrogenase [Planctomycetota bacterium]
MTTLPATVELLAELCARRVPVAVVGLGYVGLPLAVCLARVLRVIGYDSDAAKIARLAAGHDATATVTDAELAASGITFTAEPAQLRAAGVVIVAVPTPVDEFRRPDLSPLLAASATVGAHLARGAVVVYESTVYPGATREVCVPELERASGLTLGAGFTVGYSPERINPGDTEHTIERIVKVVSGSDAATLEVVAGVYGAAIPAGVHRCARIEVAEAAKVIENTQRDLNIALMNELALIFHRLGLDTLEVLAAAGTKWNFLPFRPGLVGGHCIGVDPYYLTHKAQAVGYHPQVILAGRRINDGMGRWIAQECVRLLIQQGRAVQGAAVLVLGLTFKEDVGDVRNSRVADLIAELQRFGARPRVRDPVADPAQVQAEHGIALIRDDDATPLAAVIVAVAHRAFRTLDLAQLAARCGPGAPFLDVKGLFVPVDVTNAGFLHWRL